MPIPLIIYGDGPRIPSGLARIARDLTARLVGFADDLGIKVAQVGVDWPGGWHWQGWDFMGFQPTEKDQGREAVQHAVDTLAAETGEKPIVLMIMDPARCFDLTRSEARMQPVASVNFQALPLLQVVEETLKAEFWGYFPIDAENLQGRIGGPAAQAVGRCHRVLGYGRYGARVLKRTLEYLAGDPAQIPPISYLPHGIETRMFRPDTPTELADQGFLRWVHDVQDDGAVVLGCVATNQPRKDWGLLFQTLRILRGRGVPARLWLHTDKLTHAWDVGELAVTCDLPMEAVCVSTEELTDQQLAARYVLSDLTIAPGLGEGYGYPIVESLSCGTPVVHGKYAGGIELTPPEMLVDPESYRLEGMYAVRRPVYQPYAFANRIEALLPRCRDARFQTFCRGSVAHLDWEFLWPAWQAWIAKGLEARRGGA